MNNEEINKSMIETIKSPDLEGMTIDFSEIVLDHLSELDGVAKDIPIIGTIVKVIKTGITIKDIIFLKKLGKFLWHLKEIPADQRFELIKKLEKDSKCKTDVGSKIILLLDRVDDFEKPRFMANAFKAYLYGHITYPQLQRMNFAIDHLFIDDIEEFKSNYSNSQHSMDDSTHQNLALCGLGSLIQLFDGGTNLKTNELGVLFAQYVLECS